MEGGVVEMHGCAKTCCETLLDCCGLFTSYMHVVEYTCPMDERIYTQQAKLFRTLNHPGRLAILEVLRGGEQCVCHIEALLGLRQAYVSQQLAVLREAGLVNDRRDGLNIFYRVVRPEVYALLDVARLMLSVPPPASARQPVTCVCPKCVSVDAMLIS